MSIKTIEELIILAKQSKDTPGFPADEARFYELIISELRRIQMNPNEDFSPVLSRSLIDGSWETPFFKPFNLWLDAHRRRIGVGRR